MRLAEQKCESCNSQTKPLSQEAVKELQREIPDWKLKEGAIEREFQFKDFKEAMGFVNHVADAANQMDHHPDIYISYNKVKIELSTHKIKGLSKNDFILAAKIDELIGSAV